MTRRPELIVIGVPGGRRVDALQQSLRLRGAPPARVVSYLDLLEGRVTLPEIVGEHSFVRLESPERDFEVERGLIAAGADEPDEAATASERIDRASAMRLEFERGRLRLVRQGYLGFRALLRTIGRQRQECQPHRISHEPAEVAVMFDKPAAHERFARSDVPVPRGLGTPCDYADLRERMNVSGISRVFVKLAHGSSASGVLALEVYGARVQARTTVELVRGSGDVRLYNTRDIRRLSSEQEVASIVDALCRERAQAEQWFPKASLPGGTFDLRVVVIAGLARHRVARVSRSPMTNLHLLNERGDVEAVKVRMTTEAWASAMATCERAAALFPGCLHAGVDLAIASGFRSHAILEINAFGDLLNGVTHDGQDTHTAELEAAGLLESAVPS